MVVLISLPELILETFGSIMISEMFKSINLSKNVDILTNSPVNSMMSFSQ